MQRQMQGLDTNLMAACVILSLQISFIHIGVSRLRLSCCQILLNGIAIQEVSKTAAQQQRHYTKGLETNFMCHTFLA